MGSDTGSPQSSRESVVIVDSMGVFYSIVWTVVLLIAAWLFFAPDPSKGWPVAILLVLLAAATLWIGIVKGKGTVVDFSANQLRYPGGGVAAGSFFGNLNPKHWVQMGKRFETPIEGVTQLAYKKKWTAMSRFNAATANKDTKDDAIRNQKSKHVVQFSGKHGTASVSFRSEAKCDELLGNLKSVLPKGTPVIDPRMGFGGDSGEDED